MDNVTEDIYTTGNVNATTTPCQGYHAAVACQSDEPKAGSMDYVDMILYPVVMVIGILGNIFSIIILSKTSSCNLKYRYILIALAVSDMTLLLTHPFNKSVVHKAFGMDLRAITTSGCKVFFLIFRTKF